MLLTLFYHRLKTNKFSLTVSNNSLNKRNRWIDFLNSGFAHWLKNFYFSYPFLNILLLPLSLNFLYFCTFLSSYLSNCSFQGDFYRKRFLLYLTNPCWRKHSNCILLTANFHFPYIQIRYQDFTSFLLLYRNKVHKYCVLYLYLLSNMPLFFSETLVQNN